MERPFDYPGSSSDIVSPEPHHLVRSEHTQRVHHQYGEIGEYATTYTLYFAPDWWTEEEIKAVVANRFEAERCYHSHDCCGRFYAGRGRVVDIQNGRDEHGDKAQLVLIRIDYAQNV